MLSLVGEVLSAAFTASAVNAVLAERPPAARRFWRVLSRLWWFALLSLAAGFWVGRSATFAGAGELAAILVFGVPAVLLALTVGARLLLVWRSRPRAG